MKREYGLLLCKCRGEIDNQIKIEDNGICFDIKKSESGIGLSNIQERLKLHYKENADFFINSVPDKGTRVIITIPRIGRKKEKQNAHAYNS